MAIQKLIGTTWLGTNQERLSLNSVSVTPGITFYEVDTEKVFSKKSTGWEELINGSSSNGSSNVNSDYPVVKKVLTYSKAEFDSSTSTPITIGTNEIISHQTLVLRRSSGSIEIGEVNNQYYLDDYNLDLSYYSGSVNEGDLFYFFYDVVTIP